MQIFFFFRNGPQKCHFKFYLSFENIKASAFIKILVGIFLFYFFLLLKISSRYKLYLFILFTADRKFS